MAPKDLLRLKNSDVAWQLSIWCHTFICPEHFLGEYVYIYIYIYGTIYIYYIYIYIERKRESRVNIYAYYMYNIYIYTYVHVLHISEAPAPAPLFFYLSFLYGGFWCQKRHWTCIWVFDLKRCGFVY